jgi:hypothetical protein
MPVSKLDARAGTIRGRYTALRRAWRDRKALKDEARTERIREFINRPLRDDSRAQHARRVNLADWLADGNTFAEWCEHNGVSLTPPD